MAINSPPSIEKNNSKMNIYCCGGAGVNMGFLLKKAGYHGMPGYADVDIIFVDVNTSNMRGRDVNTEDIYIIDGRDGSGGLRAENSSVIAKTMDDLLLRHPPARYNLVISSGSGGTGSVIAPHIVGKLLSEDALVVAITIGDTSTGIFAKNSIKTIQSFSGVVSKFPQKTLPMTVVLNHRTRSRQSVDNAVCQQVSYYAALFSETMLALDYSDIYNWAHQERVTGIKAPLTMVSVNYSDAEGMLVEDPCTSPVDFETVATMLTMLANSGETALTPTDCPLPYNAIGSSLHDYSELYLPGNLNLLTHTNVNDFFDEINAQHLNTQKVFNSRKAIVTVAEAEHVDGDGMAY